MEHLIMVLEAPMMSFGGEIVDNHGVTLRFPTARMLTGLLANSMGWHRYDGESLDALQERLVYAARLDREPVQGYGVLRDFQTVALGAGDRGWTTWGVPEGRAGSPATFDSPHLRYRDYLPDVQFTVALRLVRHGQAPVLQELADALGRPARPLFLGRKPCIPSRPVLGGMVDAENALAALQTVPLAPDMVGFGEHLDTVRVFWPDGENQAGFVPGTSYVVSDLRDWQTNLLNGGRMVHEADVPRELFPAFAPGVPDEEREMEPESAVMGG